MPDNLTPSSEGERIVLSSDDLFKGRKEVVIKHGEEYYRLLITKAGKLILNK